MAQNKQTFVAQPVVTSAYVGEMALPYVHALVLSAPTMSGGNVTLIQNVRKSAQLPVMATASLLQTGACDFATTATTSLIDTPLSVTDLMVNLQLCKKNFRNWWQGDDYTINSGVPNDYADALLLYVAGEVQGEMENNIWMGNVTGATGTPTRFAGLVKQWDANGGTVSTLTKSLKVVTTVIEGLAEAISEMPIRLKGDYENTKVFVNPAVLDRYNVAIGQLGGGYNNSTANGGIITFGGYSMVAAFGLDDGYIVTARAQDLFVGVGQADSVELAQAIDMTPLDGSDNYRITMRFAVGTQVPVWGNAKVQKSA